MKWFMVFVGLTLFGTFIAFISGNWGFARRIVRLMFQYYALGILTLSLFDTPERASTLLRLYFFSFLYYAIWGLISLRMTPITSDIDPGARKLVYWHLYFDNRDGFGPLMVMGFVYSLYLYRAMLRRFWRLLASATAILCIVGVIISFGRGVFLALVVTIGHIWIKTKRKILTTVALVTIVVVFFSAVPELAHRYWDTIETIWSEGTQTGTGLDRKILWGWAWQTFLSSPIYGVGIGNFGSAASEIVDYNEAATLEYTPGRLWGRALHCAPMTVLCEYGLIGAVIMFCLIVDVFRTNRQIRKNAIRFANPGGESNFQHDFFYQPSALTAVYNGLNAIFLTIIISAFFYELLYAPLFWHFIIINRLIYQVSLEYERTGEIKLD